MSDRSSTDYQHGVPNQVTTMQPDLDAAAAFYAGLFGWEFARSDDDGGYLLARLRGREAAAIAPLPPMLEDQPAAGWVTNVQVDDPDAIASAAVAAGGTVLAGPFDLPRGRQVVIEDPTGAALAAWKPAGVCGAEVVNEFGAWAMTSLTTPDPDVAAVFYGAVFGWTTEAFGPATMFRLPGFVGGEPEQPVSRETVATMMPGDGPAAWEVDFWVPDAAAAAARATELGGSLLAEPMENPVGWHAVLADPAGAAFSVSQLRLYGV